MVVPDDGIAAVVVDEHELPLLGQQHARASFEQVIYFEQQQQRWPPPMDSSVAK